MTKRIPKDQQKRRGPKELKFTEAQHAEVRTLAAANYNQEAIAHFLGISVEALVKHFAPELATTKMKMIANAANRLVEAVNKGEAWAICFTLKTQGKDLGWSERHEHTGADGGAIPLRLESLTDAQLGVLIERIEQRITSRAG